MFRIGEFSKIAQVSGRLLRYYDEIGLLKPEHIDTDSGYRFYSAHQLPRLNRILALKDLGLSLDQIARFLDDDISEDEIRGMLMMKKAQIEQTLLDELARFKHIESRLNQLDDKGTLEDYDVVIKSVPDQPFLAVREMCPTVDDGFRLLHEITHILPARIGSSVLGHFTVIVYSDMFEQEDIDLEAGYLLNRSFDDSITLSDGRMMTVRTAPALDMVASIVRSGRGHLEYNALGFWLEANNYRIIGPGREVFLELPDTDNRNTGVTEIQFPVEKVSNDFALLP